MFSFYPLSSRPCLFLLLFFTALAGLSSCTDECETTIAYTVQEPIQITRTAMIQAVESGPARKIAVTGKIYAKGHLVFVNEPYRGIHVIDNQDPAAPRQVAFINISGNVDMAIRDNVLFADAGPDLLALDISDLNQVKVKKHVFNTFQTPCNWETGTAITPTGGLSDKITIGY